MNVFQRRRFFLLWGPGMLVGVVLVWLGAVQTLTVNGLGFLGFAVAVVFLAAATADMREDT